MSHALVKRKILRTKEEMVSQVALEGNPRYAICEFPDEDEYGHPT